MTKDTERKLNQELEPWFEALRKNYQRALRLDFVTDPAAWALYRTWRMADSCRRKMKKISEGELHENH